MQTLSPRPPAPSRRPLHRACAALAALSAGSLLFGVAPSLDAQTAPPAPLRKRGVCANNLSPADIAALEPTVSWWYSWFHETKDGAPGMKMEFMPMIWNGGADRVAGAGRYLSANPKTRALLALNEPNLTGQANLNPQDAAKAWEAIAKLAKDKKVPLIGPHMAIGAPGNEIVKGWDPIQKKERNLSYMVDFLDAFFTYVDPRSVDGIGLHAYGHVGELKWAVEELYKKYGRPIWVTEFAFWNARDAAAEAEYMIEAVDFLERSPHVAGYAWFKSHMGKGNKMSLLEEGGGGKLTKLGQAYVNMPVHDEAVFYPVPGRVQAEADVRMQGVGIALTGDSDGGFDASKIEKGDWMDYQVEVAKAGEYTLGFRLAGVKPVALRVTQAGKPLARIEAPAPGGWRTYATATTKVRLAAGRQTLRVEADTAEFVLNWLEFAPAK